MPLPDDYLTYPHRRHGMDHDRYAWSNHQRRAPLTLPGGAKVALWVTVALEFFPLDTPAKPFKAPGGMVTPYPDLRHYTSRDYGNRVGVFRLLELFDRLGVTASFAVNGAVARRAPYLIRQLRAGGHEIIAHGVDMAALHTGGMDEADERARIADCLSALEAASGARPRGWLSPARSQSWSTPELLAGAGVEWCMDWPNDDLPYWFETKAGRLVAMPFTNELDDWQIFMTYKRGEDDFALQIADALAVHMDEAERFGGQVLSLSLRPYLSGLPYRVKPLEDCLRQALDAGATPLTGQAICDAWRASAGRG
ncbi:MAG: polysaccharide deacetylase family protein [Caulobacterales bacterium]|nr:polysaccharide deacetylase family protein [Caulobacterales bacterium]